MTHKAHDVDAERAAPEPRSDALRPRPPQALVLAILGCLALTAFDHWTKVLAEDHLSRPRQGERPPVCEERDGFIAYQRLRGEPRVVIEGLLDLEYAENCGAAFGLMRNAPALARRVVFGVAAVVAVVALFTLFWQGRGGPMFAWSVPLVASGALGNLIDRVRYGYVVDFIHVHYEPWNFDYPTFNVADIAITVGVALLILDSFRGEPVAQRTREGDAKTDSSPRAPEEASDSADPRNAERT